MLHSFDILVAEKYGVNVAIFLNNVAFWIKKNQANNKHFHNGRYWTYNSQEALAELFPYWTRQNIRTVLKACQAHGLLVVDNFNETGYDRTSWYALTDLGLSLFSCFNNVQVPIGENQPMDLVKSTVPLVRTNQPIPDIKPDIKPDKRERAPKRAPLSVNFEPNDSLEELFDQTAKRSGISPKNLFAKFMNIYTQPNAKLSADWNAELKNFLLNEKPLVKKHTQPAANEPRCTIQEWGPGHPTWEALHPTH